MAERRSNSSSRKSQCVGKSERKKTLEQLDGENWGAPTIGSHLSVSCHKLRQKPIGEFSVENLRMMIGQKFSLEWLMPLALERLQVDPMVEGDNFEGDLLSSCLKAVKTDASFVPQLVAVCQKAYQYIDQTDDYTDPELVKLVCDFLREYA